MDNKDSSTHQLYMCTPVNLIEDIFDLPSDSRTASSSVLPQLREEKLSLAMEVWTQCSRPTETTYFADVVNSSRYVQRLFIFYILV